MSLLESVKQINLYTYFFCPFAHRSLIAIIESQSQGKLPHFASETNVSETKLIHYNEIDTFVNEQTTEWYKNINPQGKVPTLQLILNDETSLTINESLVIGEFLQETFNSELLPQYESQIETTFAKSLYKIWSSYFDSNLTSLFFKIAFFIEEKPSQEKVKLEILPQIQEKISFLVEHGFMKNQKGKGDYFFGDRFSLMDCALIPFIIRFDVSLRVNFGLDLFESLKSETAESMTIFKKWYQAVRSRDSVKRASYQPVLVPVSSVSNLLKRIRIPNFQTTVEEELSIKNKKEIISHYEKRVDWFDYEQFLTNGYEMYISKLQKKN